MIHKTKNALSVNKTHDSINIEVTLTNKKAESKKISGKIST